MKADLSVGPPIDLVVYKNNLSKIVYQQSLEINDDDYQYISKQWEKEYLKFLNLSIVLNGKNNKWSPLLL